MNSQSQFSALSASSRQIIEEACEQFEQQWKAGEVPDLVTVVESYREPIRSALLRELLIIELHYRSDRSGTSLSDEAIVAAHPRLSDEIAAALHKLREVETTHQVGDTDSQQLAADSQQSHEQIPECIGKYRVIGLLDAGGQAKVYRAVHPQLAKELAIKVSQRPASGDARDRDELVEEGRVLAGLDHPHLARVYDVDFHEGYAYLVVEFIRGRNLLQHYEFEKPTPHQSARLVAKIARALDVVHRRGVVHRDIKPNNIIIDEHGEPRLIDFGLAQLSDAWTNPRGESSNWGGTPAYMAPEQACGVGSRVDAKSDIFALGAVLYWLLTGNSPFAEGNVQQTLANSRACDFDRDALDVVGEDSRLKAICLKAMAADPAGRYSSAEEMAEELEVWARSQGGSQTVKKALLVGVAALVVITIASGIGILFGPGRDNGNNKGRSEGGRFSPLIPDAASVTKDDLNPEVKFWLDQGHGPVLCFAAEPEIARMLTASQMSYRAGDRPWRRGTAGFINLAEDVELVEALYDTGKLEIKIDVGMPVSLGTIGPFEYKIDYEHMLRSAYKERALRLEPWLENRYGAGWTFGGLADIFPAIKTVRYGTSPDRLDFVRAVEQPEGRLYPPSLQRPTQVSQLDVFYGKYSHDPLTPEHLKTAPVVCVQIEFFDDVLSKVATVDQSKTPTDSGPAPAPAPTPSTPDFVTPVTPRPESSDWFAAQFAAQVKGAVKVPATAGAGDGAPVLYAVFQPEKPTTPQTGFGGGRGVDFVFGNRDESPTGAAFMLVPDVPERTKAVLYSLEGKEFVEAQPIIVVPSHRVGFDSIAFAFHVPFGDTSLRVQFRLYDDRQIGPFAYEIGDARSLALRALKGQLIASLEYSMLAVRFNPPERMPGSSSSQYANAQTVFRIHSRANIPTDIAGKHVIVVMAYDPRQLPKFRAQRINYPAVFHWAAVREMRVGGESGSLTVTSTVALTFDDVLAGRIPLSSDAMNVCHAVLPADAEEVYAQLEFHDGTMSDEIRLPIIDVGKRP